MKFFSISYMATKNDNGSCVTFLTRDEAEQCYRELVADGVYHVVRCYA